MPRVPVVGSDANAWGTVLNGYLAMVAGINVLDAQWAGGADPTGAADSTAAIQAALNAAAPGQTVTLPNGIYKTTVPLILPQGVTLAGPQANQQAALGSTSDWGAVLKPAAGFSGSGFNATAVILAQEISTSSGTNRCHIRNLMIDGSAGPASVDGFATYGSVGGFTADSVLCQFITGNAFACYADGIGNNADGLLFTHCLAQACTGHGFTLTATDATMINCHGQSCGGDAIRLTGNNARLFGCRGDLSTNGITIQLPASPAGGNYSSGYSDSITLTGCGTQLNTQNGLNILDSFGTGTPAATMVIVSGCSFDMDGVNGGAGGGGYAGISVNGLAVVTLSNTRVMTDTHGVTGGSPQYAITTSASATGGRVPVSVRVAGASWLSGVTAIYNDAAPASSWSVASDTLTYTGAHSGHIAAANVTTPPVTGWTAQDMGYAAIPYDPNMLSNGGTTRLPAAGVLQLVGLQIRAPQTIQGKADLWIINTPSGLANSYLGLYNSAGTLLGASADQSTSWDSTGWKLAIAMTAQFTGAFTLTPGLYWVGLLAGSGTTLPSFATPNTSSQNTEQANGARLGAANARFGTYGSGLTALPSSITPSSITVSLIAWWAGLY